MLSFFLLRTSIPLSWSMERICGGTMSNLTPLLLNSSSAAQESATLSTSVKPRPALSILMSLIMPFSPDFSSSMSFWSVTFEKRVTPSPGIPESETFSPFPSASPATLSTRSSGTDAPRPRTDPESLFALCLRPSLSFCWSYHIVFK